MSRKMYLAYSTEYSNETHETNSTDPIGVYKTRDKAISVIKELSEMDDALDFKTNDRVENFIYNQAQGLIYNVTPVEVEEDDEI